MTTNTYWNNVNKIPYKKYIGKWLKKLFFFIYCIFRKFEFKTINVWEYFKRLWPALLIYVCTWTYLKRKQLQMFTSHEHRMQDQSQPIISRHERLDQRISIRLESTEIRQRILP